MESPGARGSTFAARALGLALAEAKGSDMVMTVTPAAINVVDRMIPSIELVRPSRTIIKHVQRTRLLTVIYGALVVGGITSGKNVNRGRQFASSVPAFFRVQPNDRDPNRLRGIMMMI